MVDRNLLTEEQARDHPNANVVTRAFGQKPDIEFEISAPMMLQPGDRIMLCSDGLCGYVEDAAIEQASQRRPVVDGRTIDQSGSESSGGVPERGDLDRCPFHSTDLHHPGVRRRGGFRVGSCDRRDDLERRRRRRPLRHSARGAGQRDGVRKNAGAVARNPFQRKSISSRQARSDWRRVSSAAR